MLVNTKIKQRNHSVVSCTSHLTRYTQKEANNGFASKAVLCAEIKKWGKKRKPQ